MGKFGDYATKAVPGSGDVVLVKDVTGGGTKETTVGGIVGTAPLPGWAVPAIDPEGSVDAYPLLQAALNSYTDGGVVCFPGNGTYKLSQTLKIPSNVQLLSLTRAYARPSDNYGLGLGELDIVGAVLKPTSTFTGSSVIALDNSAAVTQMGGQQLWNVAVDCRSLPAGTVHGIRSIGAVACVTMRGCLVYKPTGNCYSLDLDSGNHPADNWDIQQCVGSGAGGRGFAAPGLADSVIIANEMTTNSGGGWLIHDWSNCRVANNRGEQSGSGPNWQVEIVYASGAYLFLENNHSEYSQQDGWLFTGAGAGVIRAQGCSSVGDGLAGGSYSGVRVSACASVVRLPELVVKTGTQNSATGPLYGLRKESASAKVTYSSVVLQGTTAALYDDGSNAIPLNPPASTAEKLTSGEAIFGRTTANSQATLNSGQVLMSYWTAGTDGSATSVVTAVVNTAAAGLSHAEIGVYSVDSSGNLTRLATTGDLHSTLWAAAFTSYTSTLTWTRVAGCRYALAVLAVGTTMPQLQAASMYYGFDALGPLTFGTVSGQTALPSSITAGSVTGFAGAGPMAAVAP